VRKHHRHRFLPDQVMAHAAEETLNPMGVSVSAGNNKVDIVRVQTSKQRADRINIASICPTLDASFDPMIRQMRDEGVHVGFLAVVVTFEREDNDAFRPF
jgi:hypothetical protein